MKPFLNINKVKTFHCPVDPGLSMLNLNNLIARIVPKRVVCPNEYY